MSETGKAKHDPGPYALTIKPGHSVTVVLNPDPQSPGADGFSFRLYGVAEMDSVTIANAELLRSAPDLLRQRDALLAAAKELLRMTEAAHRSLGMWTDTNPRIVKARAAIADAEKGSAQ